MPKSRRKGKCSCGDPDDQDDHDDIAITLVKLLNNDQVLMKLRSALFRRSYLTKSMISLRNLN